MAPLQDPQPRGSQARIIQQIDAVIAATVLAHNAQLATGLCRTLPRSTKLDPPGFLP